MSTTGCLITSTPQFTAEEHTRPFLDTTSALPSTLEVLKVDTADIMLHESTALVFSADVISQDDAKGSSGAFQSVESRLYIDYGTVPFDPTQPFVWLVNGNTIDPGTLDQTNRLLSAGWLPAHLTVPNGCHTVTLVASHQFDEASGCPVCADDYSTITWIVNRCDMTNPGGCDTLAVPCPSIATTCAQAQAQNPHATPCTDAVDGGVQ